VVVDAIPEALGPMLMTLLGEPQAFEMMGTAMAAGQVQETTTQYSEAQCHLVQQQAIERVLGWIVRDAQTRVPWTGRSVSSKKRVRA
jgi:hypothetical protein